MDETTFQALIRLLAFQQVQIVALKRLVERGHPEIPVSEEIAEQCFQDTLQKTGVMVEDSVRDFFRGFHVGQQMAESGLESLWDADGGEPPASSP